MKKNKLLVRQFGLNGYVEDYDSEFNDSTINMWLNSLLNQHKNVQKNKHRNGVYDITYKNIKYRFYVQKLRNYGIGHNDKNLRVSLRIPFKQYAINDYQNGIVPIFIGLYHYYDKYNDFHRYISTYIPIKTILNYSTKKESSLSIDRTLLFDNFLEKKDYKYKSKNQKFKGIKFCSFNDFEQLLSLIEKHNRPSFYKTHIKGDKYTGKLGSQIECAFALKYDKNNFQKYAKWEDENVCNKLSYCFEKIDEFLKETNDEIVAIVGNKCDKNKKRLVYDLITKQGKRISIKSSTKGKPTFCPPLGETCYKVVEEIYCIPYGKKLPLTTKGMRKYFMENCEKWVNTTIEKMKNDIDYTFFIFQDSNNNFSLKILDHKNIHIKKMKKEHFHFTANRKTISNENEWNYSCQVYYKDIQLSDFEIKNKGLRIGKSGVRFRYYYEGFVNAFYNNYIETNLLLKVS